MIQIGNFISVYSETLYVSLIYLSLFMTHVNYVLDLEFTTWVNAI